MQLYDKYPPSPPCSCKVCKSYCCRPGWWTVEEASHAIDSGYAGRMMLEMDADFSFGVLSPAFRGCESNFALQEFAKNGCCFLSDGLCELHGTDFQPLECRFCHHSRQGLGQRCHHDLEISWDTKNGKRLIQKWISTVGIRERYGL